jgi:hypothetical protein
MQVIRDHVKVFNFDHFYANVYMVSISSTFYLNIFHMKVLCTAFLKLQFGFEIFCQKNISTRAARKMLIKLTPAFWVPKSAKPKCLKPLSFILQYRGRFHQRILTMILLAHIQNAQKEIQVTSVYLLFLDLSTQKLLIKCW